MAAAVGAAGCRPERALGEGSPAWWLVLPVIGFLLLAALLALLAPDRQGVHAASRNSPRGWRRRLRRTLPWTLGIAALAAFTFAAVNLSTELEPTRKLCNIGFWFLGTMLGAGAALLVGERLGDSTKSTRLEVW